MQIREMRGTDMSPRFLRVLTTLAEVDLTPAEALEIFRSRLRVGIRTFIALANGDILGTASLFVEEKFIHGGSRVGHIEDVAVAPEAQGQGVGSALVRYATEEAGRLGCYKVILNCVPERVGFYERLGFQRHDEGMRLDLAKEGPSCASLFLATPTAVIRR